MSREQCCVELIKDADRKKLMNLGMETETLEYKKSTGELKEAVISIASILNKHQKGELYFGIRKDGSPVGQVINEKTLREVS